MKKIFVMIILLLFAGYLFAQVDRSKMPEPAPAPEIQLGDYESFQLDNGLKVFVVENNKLPRVAFSLVIDRDPILEGGQVGYISAAGQLMRRGTKNRTKDQLDEEIDFMGAMLNTSSTSIFGMSLKKHTPKLLELMSDVLLNPDFKQEELDKIVKQTLSGLKAEKDDPSSIMRNIRKALVYGKDHPYGELQTETTVEAITLEKCKEYYQTYFKPNTSYLAVVGDITLGEAKDLVKKYFGEWQKGDVPTFKYKKVNAPLVRKVSVVDRPQSVQSVINISYPIDLIIGSPDDIKVSLLNKILGGGSTGRFFLNLREDKGYTYGAYSSMASDRLVGHFTASCEASNSVTDSAVTEFLVEMKKIISEKVTDTELQAAKNFLTGSFSRSLEQPQTIASFALNIERFNLPKDYYKKYLMNLSVVTVDDINEMANKYIKPNKANIIVVGNGEEIEKGLEKFSVSGKVNYYDMYGEKYDPSLKKLPEGVTAEAIMENYITAIGGRENILKVKDKSTTMKGSIQGMNIVLDIYQKAPNKYYQKFDAGMMKQETVFDGEKGKASGMGQETLLEGDKLLEMKIQAEMNAFLDYDKLGVKLELTGVEAVDGKDAYKITLTLPNDKKWFQFYDQESGFLIKQTLTVDTPQGSFNQTLTFGDYKDVGGVKYPHKLSQSFGPQSIELEVASIEINKDLSDQLFVVK
ncbi:MAG: insulinase family protein [Bacteroidetes bacterium]|nr:insulinase family protein [Bacteroidota bacterium]MBU1677513.1 insulinase family protein [Bacteroidota bacterium]MBU2508604.1 insulinase family protein [Bacteroidota bacterium]